MKSSCLFLALALLAPASPSLAAGISLPDKGTTVRFRGHDAVLTTAWINGHGPCTVIFDTGANTIVSKRLARQLGLVGGADKRLQAFAGSVDTDKAVIDRFRIGALVLTNFPVHVVAFPFSLTHMSRRPIVAAIGLDLVPLLSIRLDSTAHTLSFFPPAQFTPPTAVQPAQLLSGPDGFSVEGKLDGEPARFDLDTGQDVSLTVYSTAVRDRGLVARYHAISSGVTGQGFGGATRGWLARARSIEVDGTIVRGSLAKLSVDTAGLGAGAATGNLGMGFLKRFTVSFDGPRKRIYFEPNAAIEAPDPYNRAGLQMEEQADGAHVVAVLPASPAFRAGLRIGDVVMSANGQSFSYGQAFDVMFLRPGGTELALRVRGRRHVVRLILHDVI